MQGTKHIKPSQVKVIVEPASLSLSEKISDWYLLNLVLKNLDSVVVDQLLEEIFRSQEMSEPVDIDKETEEKQV